ncbi:MAG: SGNH/GDSL hydrolase family protein [Verrucomicrobiales bacterium]|nr:SGNH/GDSL hydrolase family protein [Verrucomicrobiales bacterium]
MALPIAVIALLPTVLPAAIHHVLQPSPSLTTAATIAALLLLLAEGHWLISWWYWLRAGGRSARAAELLARPAAVAARRRLALRLTAGTISLAGALLACELLFRALDIRTPAPPQPQYLDAQSVDNTLNALGIREPWDDLTDDGRLRIAFLGDSFTYGEAVEAEETFCSLIEDNTTIELPGGLVTINLGRGGTAPAQQKLMYDRVGPILRPEVVVHVLYLNDLEDVNTHKALRAIYHLRDEELWLGNWSRLFNFVEKQVRYRLAMRETINYFRGGRNEAQRERAWARFERDVRETQCQVREAGGTYAIVLFPWFFQLGDYPLLAEHQRIAALAADMDAPFLDLLSLYGNMKAANLRISPANEHPTPRAHRLAADRIARFLSDDVLPGRSLAPPEPPRIDDGA